MTHVACRLTAKDRDQLRDPTLGYRVRASVTFLCGEGGGAAAAEQRAYVSALERLDERRLASSAVSEHHNAHSLERLAGHGQLTTAHLAAVSHQRLHHNSTLQTPPPVLLPGVSPGCALAGTDGLPADDGTSRTSDYSTISQQQHARTHGRLRSQCCSLVCHQDAGTACQLTTAHLARATTPHHHRNNSTLVHTADSPPPDRHFFLNSSPAWSKYGPARHTTISFSPSVHSSQPLFTARCYASAVLATGLCPSVCPSVCHKSVFY